jgi:hypothetical protein
MLTLYLLEHSRSPDELTVPKVLNAAEKPINMYLSIEDDEGRGTF